MKDVADIIAVDTTGEWEMGKYTGRRTSPPHDEIAQLAFSCMSRVADRTATTSKIGCVPNRNSGGTTRNCGVPTKTYEALKWRRSSERSIYDIHKTDFGAGMSHVRHAGSTGG